jgi:hypothetical protein
MILMFWALHAADPERPAPQPNPLSLENPRVFDAELGAAGFADVSVTPHEQGIWVESADAYWQAVARSSAPLVMLRNRLGEAEWQRQSALAAAYLAEQITSPRELSTTAYLGFGRRPA